MGTSVLEKALSSDLVDGKTYNFWLSGSSYGGDDLPNANYAYGFCEILRRSNASAKIILYGETYPPMYNAYNGNSWSGWKRFSDLAQQTITPLSGTSEEVIDELLNNHASSYSNNTYYTFAIGSQVAHSVLGGGTYYVEGYKASSTYGWQKITSYIKNKTFTRYMNNGTWSDYS